MKNEMLVDITQCATYSMNFISRTHHQWWVACVLQTEVNDEVKVGFLHPNGPSRSLVSLARLSRGRRESGQTPIVELCNLDDVNLSGAKWV